VLATVPLWLGNTYHVNIMSQILIAAIFALSLNVLVGYAGLISLGHAGLFGVAAYTTAIMLSAGFGHLAAILAALVMSMVVSAGFAALALRTTGIGFIMISLALGQILWGLAYRWIDLTNGDNGLAASSRPAPFGLALNSAGSFYPRDRWWCLSRRSLPWRRSRNRPSVRASKARAIRHGRMTALGYDVWMIRFLTCVFFRLLERRRRHSFLLL